MNTTPEHASPVSGINDISWVQPLIGTPWVIGGRDTTGFDCWGLLWYVYRTQFGIELPNYPERQPLNVSENWRIAQQEMASPHWRQIVKPSHGDAIGLSASRKVIHHVGIFLDVDGGLVLHATDKRHVVAQSIQTLRTIGLQTVLFYRHDRMPSAA